MSEISLYCVSLGLKNILMISHRAHTNLSWIAGLALQLYNHTRCPIGHLGGMASKRLDSTVAMATTCHEELLEVVVVTVQ